MSHKARFYKLSSHEAKFCKIPKNDTTDNFDFVPKTTHAAKSTCSARLL